MKHGWNKVLDYTPEYEKKNTREFMKIKEKTGRQMWYHTFNFEDNDENYDRKGKQRRAESRGYISWKSFKERWGI